MHALPTPLLAARPVAPATLRAQAAQALRVLHRASPALSRTGWLNVGLAALALGLLPLDQRRADQLARAATQARLDALAGRVAPLSVQELVENALKHNEASRARPLHLRVAAGPGVVHVENTYQPRLAGLVPGTGTGLANLRQRYALLGAAAPVAIRQVGGTFAVTLPLP